MIGANQCQHGQLARKCQLCEDEEEIAQLKTRVRVLREAVQHYESALRDAWPEGAKGASWEFWNRARAALEKT